MAHMNSAAHVALTAVNQPDWDCHFDPAISRALEPSAL